MAIGAIAHRARCAASLSTHNSKLSGVEPLSAEEGASVPEPAPARAGSWSGCCDLLGSKKVWRGAWYQW